MNKNTTEIGLIEKWQKEGCIKSRNEIIVKYYDLIHFCSNKYPEHLQMHEDLFNQGVEGLIHALNKFDTNREGVQPITYFMWWIRFYMQKPFKTFNKLIESYEPALFEGTVGDDLSPSDLIEDSEFIYRIYEMINAFDDIMYKVFQRRLNGITAKDSGLEISASWDKYLYSKGIKKIQEKLNVESI